MDLIRSSRSLHSAFHCTVDIRERGKIERPQKKVLS